MGRRGILTYNFYLLTFKDFQFPLSSLYIHIPFCQSRCLYCDFYSTTQQALRDRYVDALCVEMQHHKGNVATVYLGGGTPSQLTPRQLDRIFDALHIYYKVADDAEITVECNPDDVTPERLHHLRSLGVNRLSMGIQTFDDDTLRFLRRRHTAEQAVHAVSDAQDAGFNNLSIDLMFGFPQRNACSSPADARSLFANDLKTALSLDIQHLSAYSLMYEPGTPLTRLRDSGEVQACDDETALALYEMLLDRTAEADFEHYEISNFARPGFRSRHNSAYWNDTPYIGLGAGAHAYDGTRRYYHPDDLTAYLQNPLNLVTETLSPDEHYNEYVMTRLRTCEGLNLPTLLQRFGPALHDHFLACARPHLEAQRLVQDDDKNIRLSRSGIFVSDDIMSDCMKI